VATGRIGATPVLRVRWSKLPTTGTTVLSGLDDNSVALVYDAGYEAVYRNGVLLSRGNDYTATNGTTVTLIDATLAGDVVEIFANDLVPLTDAISKGQYTAKGALLSASAASTPGVVTVGANDTVLTADSSTATGLKWATPAAGGMTLLSTTTLSGASTTISSIDQTYKNLQIVAFGITNTNNFFVDVRPNASSVLFTGSTQDNTSAATAGVTQGNLRMNIGIVQNQLNSNSNNVFTINFYNYASTTAVKTLDAAGGFINSSSSAARGYQTGGYLETTSAISSIVIASSAGTFSTGTVLIYGVK
jgi:hypothetical protein